MPLREALGHLMARAAWDNPRRARAKRARFRARSATGLEQVLWAVMRTGNELAIFDFDKTLVAGDSFQLFSRMAATSLGERAYGPWAAALCKAGLISNAGYKQRVLQRLWQRRTPDAQAKILSGLYRQLERRAYGTIARHLSEHLHSGHKVIVVSASPAFYVAPFVQRVWSDDIEVLASRFGHGESDNLYGARKVEVTRSLIQAHRPRAVWVYTDHRSDLPLIEIADHVRLVRPSAALQRILRARGIGFEIMAV
jgi:HAD superfamily phosphoserine phosphatase-like hydrolase